MAYLCPRDHTRLQWRDFFQLGRWHCRKCSGTLVYEKHLREFPAFARWLGSLTIASEKAQLPCPICRAAMRAYEFGHHEGLVQVERCERCRSYWFDPGEIPLLSPPPKPLPLAESGISLKQAFAECAEYKLARARRLKNALRILGILLVATDVWMYLATREFADEYGRIGHRLALDPATAALFALPFLCAFAIRPIRWRTAIIPAGYFLAQGALVWAARY